MGLDRSHVLQSEENFRHLQCVACKQLTSLESFVFRDCNHVICKECVSTFASGLDTCLFCSTKVIDGLQCLKTSQPLAHRVLGSIRVACPFRHVKCCGWTGDYMKLSQHLKSDHALITKEIPSLIPDHEVTNKNMGESFEDDYSEMKVCKLSKNENEEQCFRSNHEHHSNYGRTITRRSTIDTIHQSSAGSTTNKSSIAPQRASTGNGPLEKRWRTRSNQRNDHSLPLPANVQRIFARRLSTVNNDTKFKSDSRKNLQNIARRASMGTCCASSEGIRNEDTKKRSSRAYLRRASMPTSSMMAKMQQDNDHRRDLLLDGDFFVAGGINLNLISTTHVFDLKSTTNLKRSKNKTSSSTIHGGSSGVPLRLLKDQCCSAGNAAA